MNVKTIRRENLRALAQDLGSITALADYLGKSQSQMSRLIGRHPIKNIGDKLAAEIENAFDKPSGWLDWRHAGIQDAIVQERIRAITHSQVPLLDTTEIAEWVMQPETDLRSHSQQLISVTTQASQYAFAIQVKDNSMESASSGISFPKGAIIVADPEHIVRDGSYVIVRLEDEAEPIFRQCIKDGTGTYLKPLNPKYPTRKLNYPHALFCGVVRQMIMQVG